MSFTPRWWRCSARTRSLSETWSTAREGEQDGGEAIDQILLAKMGPLGVDGKNRNYYILDGETAEILASSDDDGAQTLESSPPTS